MLNKIDYRDIDYQDSDDNSGWQIIDEEQIYHECYLPSQEEMSYSGFIN
jgi:hypothetical protein